MNCKITIKMERKWRLCCLAGAVLVILVGFIGVALPAGTQQPEVYGQWSQPFTDGNQKVLPIHTSLLPTGKVMYFWTEQNSSNTDVRLWDPDLWNPITGGGFSSVISPVDNIFCSGHSFLPDGKLLVTGGHVGDHMGLSDVNIYDPFKSPTENPWTSAFPMNAGRWYPTNTALSNGDVLVISGDNLHAKKNLLPQVWQTELGLWRNLSAAQNVKAHGYGLSPRMFLVSDGRVYKVGEDKDAWYLNTANMGEWKQGASSSVYRREGSAVMYDEGKILIMGGRGGLDSSDPSPTNTAEVIDLNAASPKWRSAGSMSIARQYHNATILPNGKILVTGGTDAPGHNNLPINSGVYKAEMWDPAIPDKWFLMASMQMKPRVYHSIALLLLDGRVLIGGGGRPAPKPFPNDYNFDFEIYSPPYLFKTGGQLAERPVISSAPTTVIYGEEFFVETPNPALIAQANWIRLGSVTHAFDQNQRINKLAILPTPIGIQALKLRAPASGNLCPPGHYMLFILDTNGVPSVAKIIKIGANTPPINPNDTDGDGILNVDDECPMLPTSKVIVGTTGKDYLKGTSGNDLIRGLGGNDRIEGRGGDDCLVGGDGDDRLYGNDGNDILLGETGKDKLSGDNGNDTLDGGENTDYCSGGSGTDIATNCEKVSRIP